MTVKEKEYQLVVKQAEALLANETDYIANAANLSALIFNSLEQLNWVGFYFVRKSELVLGPFQGQVACVRIGIGKGVCGSAVASREVQRVDDVHLFDGHIACDAASNSELVVPLFDAGKVVAVLDIDSPITSRFDEVDQRYLVEMAELYQRCSDLGELCGI